MVAADDRERYGVSRTSVGLHRRPPVDRRSPSKVGQEVPPEGVSASSRLGVPTKRPNEWTCPQAPVAGAGGAARQGWATKGQRGHADRQASPPRPAEGRGPAVRVLERARRETAAPPRPRSSPCAGPCRSRARRPPPRAPAGKRTAADRIPRAPFGAPASRASPRRSADQLRRQAAAVTLSLTRETSRAAAGARARSPLPAFAAATEWRLQPRASRASPPWPKGSNFFLQVHGPRSSRPRSPSFSASAAKSSAETSPATGMMIPHVNPADEVGTSSVTRAVEAFPHESPHQRESADVR